MPLLLARFMSPLGGHRIWAPSCPCAVDNLWIISGIAAATEHCCFLWIWNWFSWMPTHLSLSHPSGPTLNKASEDQSCKPRTTQMHHGTSEHSDNLFLDTWLISDTILYTRRNSLMAVSRIRVYHLPEHCPRWSCLFWRLHLGFILGVCGGQPCGPHVLGRQRVGHWG